MARQNNSISRNDYENKILALEKKYYNMIVDVVNSEAFINDLLLIEKEIRENYPEFRDIWDLKNKIKVPAERLARHHIYTQWHDYIKGIYPSPVSSDIGLKMADAIVCIDLKTIDTNGNSGDIRSTAVENNQTSFNNKNYPYIKTASNLKSIDHYSRLPVLTFVIKIIYNDDKYSFKLSRHAFPTIITACVPNGEISKLFDFNIIDNFKTYNYYSSKDGAYYTPMYMPKEVEKHEEAKYVEKICTEKGFIKVSINGKPAYFDMAKQVLWWQTSVSNQRAVAAVKNGGSVRFSNDILKHRFDDKDTPWFGYHEFKIEKEL